MRDHVTGRGGLGLQSAGISTKLLFIICCHAEAQDMLSVDRLQSKHWQKPEG